MITVVRDGKRMKLSYREIEILQLVDSIVARCFDNGRGPIPRGIAAHFRRRMLVLLRPHSRHRAVTSGDPVDRTQQ